MSHAVANERAEPHPRRVEHTPALDALVIVIAGVAELLLRCAGAGRFAIKPLRALARAGGAGAGERHARARHLAGGLVAILARALVVLRARLSIGDEALDGVGAIEFVPLRKIGAGLRL